MAPHLFLLSRLVLQHMFWRARVEPHAVLRKSGSRTDGLSFDPTPSSRTRELIHKMTGKICSGRVPFTVNGLNGLNIGEISVSKYMTRHRNPPPRSVGSFAKIM
jgi:hypothetical protein